MISLPSGIFRPGPPEPEAAFRERVGRPGTVPAVEGSPAHPRPRRWRRRPGVLWRRTLRGLVVLAPDGDEPVAVTGSVDELWDLLETPHRLDELVGTLASRYPDIDPTVLEGDVGAVLDRLEEVGALERLNEMSLQ